MIPQRPAYLETNYSRDDIVNGVPLPPVGGKPAAGRPPLESSPPPAASDDAALLDFRAAMRRVDTPPPIRQPEEKPVSPETTEALLRAVQKVHRVVTARIRYHEAEAARLRASLAPFATMATVGEAPPPAPNSASAIDLLVELAKALPDPPEAPQ